MQNEPKLLVNQYEDTVSGVSLRAWFKWNDEQQKKAIVTARAEERRKIMADLKPKIDRLEKLANRLP